MKELTTGDKAKLVALLESRYTIKEKKFINAIASDEEEKLNLTLMAYAIGAETINTLTNVPTTLMQTKTSVVVITRLCSKLLFVKAVKEVKALGLKEAKDLADQILIYHGEGSNGEFYSEPFIIGDSMDSKFTKRQWEKICESLWGDMVWKYVLEKFVLTTLKLNI